MSNDKLKEYPVSNESYDTLFQKISNGSPSLHPTGISEEGLENEGIDPNSIKTVSGDNPVLNALHFKITSQEHYSEYTRGIKDANSILEEYNITIDSGINMIGAESFYNHSVYLSLEGLGSILKKTGHILVLAFSKLIASIINKIRQLQNLIASVVVSKQSKLLEKNEKEYSEAWSEAADLATIKSANYSNSSINPSSVVNGKVLTALNSFKKANANLNKITANQTNPGIFKRFGNKVGLRKGIETEFKNSFWNSFLVGFKTLSDIIKTASPKAPAFKSSGETIDVIVQNVLKTSAFLSIKKIATAIFISSSNEGDIKKDSRKVSSAFKSYTSAKSYIIDKKGFVENITAMKQTAAAAKEMSSLTKRNVKKFTEFASKHESSSNKIKITAVRTSFTNYKKTVTTIMNTVAKINYLYTNLIGTDLTRRSAVMAAFKACVKQKNKK